MYHTTNRIAHTIVIFYAIHGALAGMRNSLKGSPTTDRSNNPSHTSLHITLLHLDFNISRSSQCSMTGVTKAMVCTILSVGWCI